MESKTYVVVLYDNISHTKQYSYVEAQWFQVVDKALLFYRNDDNEAFAAFADGVWLSCREEEYKEGSDDE